MVVISFLQDKYKSGYVLAPYSVSFTCTALVNVHVHVSGIPHLDWLYITL